ncbi:H-NS family nucleoid-associated regulatory protein [Caballeronia humi]|uniref:Histone family protein nucleoid-structuring protein H-NS n=1 Tax=Caballeronia humi TaxID=326474 RepID=A0A158IU00_9BURK|nr:H-NS family nucleoid-associated regulatory protein [Caballeronia humi]SAL60124.1 histone family protein nucleoid-structuring protein H-NS [Caballeronia humi]
MPTLEQIQGKMKRLQAQAEGLIAKQSKTVLADIRKLMDKHGLTTADIEAHSATKKRVGRPAGGTSAKVVRGKGAIASTASSSTKGKLPPKYRHPKTGATWSGHARPPAWIAKVRDRTKFLIDGAGAMAGEAAGANGVSKTKAAPRKVSPAARTVASQARGKGSLPPKYRDPKSGATWSGHARPPAWIANVRDRTKFLIDGVVAAAASGVAAKKPTAKKATVKKVGAAKTAATGTKSLVKKTAKKAPVASVKRVAAKKAAKPTAKNVAKSKAVSRKSVAAKKAVTPPDAPVALASTAAPETGSVPATA